MIVPFALATQPNDHNDVFASGALGQMGPDEFTVFLTQSWHKTLPSATWFSAAHLYQAPTTPVHLPPSAVIRCDSGCGRLQSSPPVLDASET
jgi:hypothetical protein